MKKKHTKTKPAHKTYSEAMSEINWGENNGRLQPSPDKDTYFAGTLPSPSAPEISTDDIKLLSEIFRGRQGLL
ncbi:MAG: hypothetical protein NTW91_08505 [Verrucomicrobia bacterium]|nr:hypothetical protein [Verrucomicrobiota bacterium]